MIWGRRRSVIAKEDMRNTQGFFRQIWSEDISSHCIASIAHVLCWVCAGILSYKNWRIQAFGI